MVIINGVSKDELLFNEYIKDCNDDLCSQNNKCLLNSSYDCSLDKKCCNIKRNKKILCVGGNEDGPTYDNNLDEWWYLGNKYNKN